MKIAALTTSRADFGILKPLLLEIQRSGTMELYLIVSGTHLLEEFGRTITEIEQSGLVISRKLKFNVKGENAANLSSAVCELGSDFSEDFYTEAPDLLMVLGDRAEIVAPVFSAALQNIPIAHIHGGEVTLGAIDNKFRNAITQLSDIHFAATKTAAKRIEGLCPENENIYHVGSLSVEQLSDCSVIPRAQILEKFGWTEESKVAILTYHPETLSPKSPDQQISQVLTALEMFPDLSILITLSNVDVGGLQISKRLKEFSADRANVVCVASMGHLEYISCLSEFDLVIGNSSSAIIEAPCFGTAVVNIGNRQTGREMAPNIASVDCQKKDIARAIKCALDSSDHAIGRKIEHPYSKSGTKKNILKVLQNFLAKRQFKGGQND